MKTNKQFTRPKLSPAADPFQKPDGLLIMFESSIARLIQQAGIDQVEINLTRREAMYTITKLVEFVVMGSGSSPLTRGITPLDRKNLADRILRTLFRK